MKNDSLGNRMKLYEKKNQCDFLKLFPIYGRFDGRAFHKFCDGLGKPFSQDFIELMRAVTFFIMKETQASAAYVQSDEISLIWHIPIEKLDLLFNSIDLKRFELLQQFVYRLPYFVQKYLVRKLCRGKTQVYFNGCSDKMKSVIASLMSVYFNRELIRYLPDKIGQMPVFDGHVFSVPTLMEGANQFVWRNLDCIKNSVQLVAQNYFSQNQLHKKHGGQLIDMLQKEKGIDWHIYPHVFKYGSFYQRYAIDGRHHIRELSIEKLADVINKVGVVYNGELPLINS